MKNHHGNSFRQIWGAPILLTGLTLSGLIAALAGAGFWHVLAWLAISTPVLVCLQYGWWQPRRKQQSHEQELRS